jgi:hypothetical protein
VQGEEEDVVMVADGHRQQSTKIGDSDGRCDGDSNNNSNCDGNSIGNGNGAMVTATTNNNKQQHKKWWGQLWRRWWQQKMVATAMETVVRVAANATLPH